MEKPLYCVTLHWLFLYKFTCGFSDVLLNVDISDFLLVDVIVGTLRPHFHISPRNPWKMTTILICLVLDYFESNEMSTAIEKFQEPIISCVHPLPEHNLII